MARTSSGSAWQALAKSSTRAKPRLAAKSRHGRGRGESTQLDGFRDANWFSKWAPKIWLVSFWCPFECQAKRARHFEKHSCGEELQHLASATPCLQSPCIRGAIILHAPEPKMLPCFPLPGPNSESLKPRLRPLCRRYAAICFMRRLSCSAMGWVGVNSQRFLATAIASGGLSELSQAEPGDAMPRNQSGRRNLGFVPACQPAF